jgi:hypothetical protein
MWALSKVTKRTSRRRRRRHYCFELNDRVIGFCFPPSQKCNRGDEKLAKILDKKAQTTRATATIFLYGQWSVIFLYGPRSVQ